MYMYVFYVIIALFTAEEMIASFVSAATVSYNSDGIIDSNVLTLFLVFPGQAYRDYSYMAVERINRCRVHFV